ncbi:hypothetical protein Salat_1789700 [Sesamum alatum]|uniref:Wall-associated receptor kinase galacturonan-binding domain-containing protein n=1 Tax=Sesamum alatum TaxID=300844 RepID=A0AAE2CKW7_9LAMI|nr:hypothetical protein Salat_1789700 [Sesamum alatum]
MAQTPPRLPFLSVFITSFSIFTNGNSVKPPPSTCAAFDCGNGLTLRCPFRPQTGNQYTGYPDFSVSCTNNQPILHISNGPFQIKNFKNSENTLTIIVCDEVSSTTTCPTVAHGFMLEPTPSLNYIKYNKIVRFYYNCTVYPPSVPNIKCLQGGAKHSYAFVDRSVPEFGRLGSSL